MSAQAYSSLLSVAGDNCKHEIECNRLVSILLNLALSLLKDNHRYKEIVELQSNPSFTRIRMMTHTSNIKLQKLIKYSNI